MGRTAEVINESAREYEETYHGKTYKIPANGKLVLPRSEALDFLGRHPGFYPQNDPDESRRGRPIAKPLSLGRSDQPEEAIIPVNHKDGKIFASEEELKRALGGEDSKALKSAIEAKDEQIKKQDEQIAQLSEQNKKLEGQINKLAEVLQKKKII